MIYAVTLWKGGFTVRAESEEEARTEALLTVMEDLSNFIVTLEPDPSPNAGATTSATEGPASDA